MVLISRTGLQESERRYITKGNSQLVATSEDASWERLSPPIAVPAPLATRPLAGLPNPFGRAGGACSILCNHPAPPSAVRGLLQAAKGKERAPLSDQNGEEDDDDEEAMVPEELFRRYTETDSRPLTPALSSSASNTQLASHSGPIDSLFCVSSPPSVSTATTFKRQGHGSLTRRSQTPDPTYHPLPPQRQRTMLVLDLRRSQSQDEGLSRQQSKGGQSPSPASSGSPKSTNNPKQLIQTNKKTVIPDKGQKLDEHNTTTKAALNVPVTTGRKKVTPKRVEKKGKASFENNTGPEQRNEVNTQVMPTSPKEGEVEKKTTPPLERKGARKRATKKKKKSIGGLDTGALMSGRGETPEKEFRGMPEPRETQISTMTVGGDTTSSLGVRGPSRATPDDALFAYDSRDGKLSTLPHTRPSTSQTRGSAAVNYAVESLTGYNEADDWDEDTFLDPSILRYLERELDRESLECEFHSLRKRALSEALRSKWLKLHHHSRKKEKLVSIGNAYKYYGLDTCHWSQGSTNLWLSLPRTYSRQSARFELPMDSQKFSEMTPLQYLQEHVAISSVRRLLYNRVFNKNRNKDKQDEELNEDDIGYPEQRTMAVEKLNTALSEIMGRDLTSSQAEYFLGLCATKENDSELTDCHNIVITFPEEKQITFRPFCGIAALCERFIGGGAKIFENAEESTENRFLLLPPRSVDPPHEIEIVDFELLPSRLRAIPKINPQLEEILRCIKDL